MNNILGIAKYQIRDFRKSLIIFYIIVSSLGIYINYKASTNTNIGVSGLELAAIIFLFIGGLNCFKDNFRFMMANNRPRKSFFIGSMVALIGVAGLMAVGNVVLGSIYKVINTTYQSMFYQLYGVYGINSIIATLLWNFGILFLVAVAGWFITMAYYKANTIMKIIISLVPVLAIYVMQYISRINADFGLWLTNSFLKAMGFDLTKTYENVNPYIAVLTFSIATIIILVFNYLLLKRMYIKD